MLGDINFNESKTFDARLNRLLFVIGSEDEINSLGARNLKGSEVKSHDTPSVLRGSLESNSTSDDDTLLGGSIASITSSELLTYFDKLNAVVIMILAFLVEVSKLSPAYRPLLGRHPHTCSVEFPELHSGTVLRIFSHEHRLWKYQGMDLSSPQMSEFCIL